MRQYAVTPPATLLRLLDKAFPQTEWEIATPGHGQQKECYIARSRTQTVFLKFDSAPLPILRRLGDIAVAPRALAGGELDRRRYVIQEYLEGQHPWGWRWFPENLPLLAQTTRMYQTAPVLRQLLAAHGPPLDYHQQIATELNQLDIQLNRLAIDDALATNLAAARASFANAIWHLSREYPHQVFVRDCWDALRRQITPHQVFAGT